MEGRTTCTPPLAVPRFPRPTRSEKPHDYRFPLHQLRLYHPPYHRLCCTPYRLGYHQGQTQPTPSLPSKQCWHQPCYPPSRAHPVPSKIHLRPDPPRTQHINTGPTPMPTAHTRNGRPSTPQSLFQTFNPTPHQPSAIIERIDEATFLNHLKWFLDNTSALPPMWNKCYYAPIIDFLPWTRILHRDPLLDTELLTEHPLPLYVYTSSLTPAVFICSNAYLEPSARAKLTTWPLLLHELTCRNHLVFKANPRDFRRLVENKLPYASSRKSPFSSLPSISAPTPWTILR